MARPKKCRHIDFDLNVTFYKPRGIPLRELAQNSFEPDEIEAIRLADLMKLSHEASASRMKVSRATFGRILSRARSKLADSILNGKAIKLKTNKE